MDELIEPITHIVNESLKSGLFPSELKLARVVPIFKSVDPSLLTNYRPISVLSFFSKFFEKIVYNLVFDFLSDNEILYDYRFGFRSKHSTQQALITLVDRVTKSLDRSNIVVSLFIDLKKAFDTVHHRILLRKLYAYGIRGVLLKWFESYLTDRSQYVIYDGVRSETKVVECGGSNYDSLIVRTVAFPVQIAYWTKRSWPPAELVFHVNLDQWSGDMAVGSCGLGAILA